MAIASGSTRRGFNWSHRFPLIVHAVMRLKVRSAIIDGEAVVCLNRLTLQVFADWRSTL
jgi:ATP-dependent DNA ligase